MPAKTRRRRDPVREKRSRGIIRRHQESGLSVRLGDWPTEQGLLVLPESPIGQAIAGPPQNCRSGPFRPEVAPSLRGEVG